ncbi:MAG: hypothetical protein R3325_04585 [Thermoanaerobaculia bacterium]|nr:hypothetical protein [Thermoanaerobaculia bacterium]
MKRIVTIAALCVALPAVAFAGGEREIERSFPLEPGQSVMLDFPVGSLTVEGWDGDEVRVELEAECRHRSRRCEERLAELEVRSRSGSRRLEVEVGPGGSWKSSRLELEAVVWVPRRAALEIEMGVGELRVEGFENDVRIDMGIGEVGVRMAEAVVRSVELDAGIGESRLSGVSPRVRERRSLLIGSELSWDEGEGRAQVEVDLGIGEISVSLG